MRITRTSQAPGSVQVEILACGIFDDEDQPKGSPTGGDRLDALLDSLRASGEIASGVGEFSLIVGAPEIAAKATLVYGLGSRGKFGPDAAFSAGVGVAKKLAGKKRERVAITLPASGSSLDPKANLAAFVEGLIVGTRGPGLRKSEPVRHPPEECVLVAWPGDSPAASLLTDETWLERVTALGEAVNFARDLVNTPPAEKPPARLADRARIVAENSGLHCEIWDAERLRQERFGGLLGVAAGSDHDPAFVILRYQAADGSGRPLALVGKGVTFDSGGLSLKPSASMEDMKADMSGAAVVLATMRAIAQRGLPIDVVGYLALTENMTGGRAMKLGDVLTMRNGKTVEVLNTDAEGRLILADALSYAIEQNPRAVIDLATLTGACLVALGPRVAGLFSNDDSLAARFQNACRKTGERAWRMPLDDDYEEGLKSQVADMKNVGGKWGGAITAAKFLQRFVGSTPWLHLDIAGPSWVESESATRDAGGTGCFVRTLTRWLEAEAETAANAVGNRDR